MTIEFFIREFLEEKNYELSKIWQQEDRVFFVLDGITYSVVGEYTFVAELLLANQNITNRTNDVILEQIISEEISVE